MGPKVTLAILRNFLGKLEPLAQYCSTYSMFNATEILIEHFVDHLRAGYRRTYGTWKADYAEIIGWAGSMALENIANSDAPYHDVEHTILVTLVGQEVLRGKHIRDGGVSPEDWLHFLVSLVCHDIGYVRGVCRGDTLTHVATGVGCALVEFPFGATDALISDYHVDRGKLFIEERFRGHTLLDIEVIKRNIELTRFPIPKQEDHCDTTGYPGLVRASDLIGQLSDLRYLQKITALFYEFKETGVTEILGYRHPGDVRQNYAQFFWKSVHPYIEPALRHLSLTQQGQQIKASLYANVFRVEHSADGIPQL